jgi:hypothetical protein
MKILNTIFLNLVITFASFAQEGTWVSTTGRFMGANVTPEEGKKNALEIARAEAIKQVVGLKVTEETFRNISETQHGDAQLDYFDVFSRLNRSTSTGRIIDEDYSIETVLENDVPIYIAKLNAKVVEEIGETDPGFNVNINLPKDVYYSRSDVLSENDAIDFEITASKDCYIYLFNIMSSDSVQLVLPNQYIGNNYYDSNKAEQEFEKQMNNVGMKFNVYLPEGKSLANEAFLVIAIKEKVDFKSDNFHQDGLSIIPTYRAAMTDIMSWLIQIPADMRTEAFRSFEIRRKYD